MTERSGGRPPDRPGGRSAAPPAAAPAPAHRAADAFRAVYGCAPAGVWAAPGRVNLIGEHTDYNDGFVLPFALEQATAAAAVPRTDGVLRLHSGGAAGGPVQLHTGALRPPAEHGWTRYPAGVVAELGLPSGLGADIHFESTVPLGAGLSSSAALEIATACALNDLHRLGLTPEELAEVGRRAENEFVGMPCGIMDQMASCCCTGGHVLHLDTRDRSARQVPFDPAAEGLLVLVVDTRVQHALSDGEYAERRAGCAAGAAALGLRSLRDLPHQELAGALGRIREAALRPLVRHVVTENLRVARTVALLEQGDVRAVGPLLTAGHASLRDDFAVSCPELDLAVETALASGALGARMTGGGFGGSAIALVDTARAARVETAVTETFATAGYRAPRLFEARPSAGARRIC